MKADKSVEKADDDDLDSFFEDESDMLLKVRHCSRIKYVWSVEISR